MIDITVAVVAKECLPGKVKTRLTPALTPSGAARVAAASLADTLATVAALPAARRVLFFDGDVLPGGADDFDVLLQPGGGLDERLGFLFDAIDGPLLLVGMDTPRSPPRRSPRCSTTPSGTPGSDPLRTGASGRCTCASRPGTCCAACRCRRTTRVRSSSLD
ncbi:hypothetical protein P9139_08055 [Curtobacterium flaccumfaciens]|nr:hypothetical protein P9139_08055 [Curtobacterium flaccumfaciens]